MFCYVFGLQAQQIWRQYCSNPRESTSDRIDMGCSHDRNSDKTEKAWLQERRKGISDGMKDTPELSLDEIQGNARMLSSHLLSETVLAEQSFQREKQHKNRVQGTLDKLLLPAEIDGEFLEVAEAFRDRMERADERNRKRKADISNILNPKHLPDPMTKKVYLADMEDSDLLQRGCLVADAENAHFIVEDDPSNPRETSLWCGVVLGACICNMDYVKNHGKKGVCFSYNASIRSKRMVFMSAGFISEHVDLSEIVRFGIAALDSKWKEIPTLEEFAELSVRRGKRHGTFMISKLC